MKANIAALAEEFRADATIQDLPGQNARMLRVGLAEARVLLGILGPPTGGEGADSIQQEVVRAMARLNNDSDRATTIRLGVTAVDHVQSGIARAFDPNGPEAGRVVADIDVLQRLAGAMEVMAAELGPAPAQTGIPQQGRLETQPAS